MNKKITIYDVATAANVSTTTVYKALHGLKGVSQKKKDEILAIANSLNYSGNVVAQTLARKEISIGVIMDAENTAFLQEVISGIKFAAKRLSDYKVTVYFSEHGRTDHINKSETLKAMDEMLNSPVNAIILYPSISYVEFQKYNDIIKKKNIPIVTVNNQPSTLNYTACVQYDGHLLGQMAAELMNLHGEAIHSAAFVGSRDVLAQSDMLASYNDALRTKNNDLLITYENQYDDKVNELLTRNMIHTHPYINAIFIGVSQSLCVIEELIKENMIDNYKIITVDVVPETLNLLSQRKILATLDRHPFLIGKLAVDILYSHLTTGCDIKGTIYVPSTVVLPCNAGNYYNTLDLETNWAAHFR